MLSDVSIPNLRNHDPRRDDCYYPPPLARSSGALSHWKTPVGGIAAGAVGGQMGSAVCTKYDCSPTGLKTLGSTTDTIWNDFGLIAGNKDIIVGTNDAGLLVVIAVRC